ncbi:hypothetical protein QUF70_17630 [Desulfobacterales bacterium HSG17]|nr:hypothetical protein [Desulfobacterales bacterium HSG17]
MYKCKADPQNNRLYIKFDGFITAEEVKEIRQIMSREMIKLKTGFNVISDISHLQSDSQIGAKDLMRLQKALKKTGAHRVVRIAGDQFVSLNFFERASREVGLIMERANSMAEAEALLDKRE